MPTLVPGREQLCKKYFMAVRSRTEEVQRYISFPMRCKSWDCEECRKDKAKSYKERMLQMWDRPHLFFITLTYFHSMTPDEAWSTYNIAWNRLRTNLVKQFGKFSFVRVLESHSNSPYPHLHLITDKRFKSTTFGPAAISAGFGFQIKQRPVTSDGARFYLTKYLTKEWTNVEGWNLRKKHRCRLISFSRDICSPAPDGGNWDSLIVGSAISACIDRCRTDIAWSTTHSITVTSEKILDDYAEITVRLEPRGQKSLMRDPEDWQPDDWCPK